MHVRSGSMCLSRASPCSRSRHSPASRVRACQHGGRASADGTSDLRRRRHRGCEDVQSQRCVRARLGELDLRGPRVTIGVFGLRREEDPRRPGHARAVTCGVRRVHYKCAHPGARAGATACSAAHISVASRTVCCVVLCLKTLHFSVSAPPCVEAYGCVGAPVVHSLDASAVPSAMRMTHAAVHPRARHTSRAGTRPADACGNEQPAARGRAQAPPLRVLGQVCCGQDVRMNMCVRARGVCVCGGGSRQVDHLVGSLANPCHGTHPQHIRAVRFQPFFLTLCHS